ncbi:hypothetical protein CRENBAI_005822 [Crenichthys baileyi]|uniref:Uncharacterized protein n=1 Tax=Crenichthys baileyi TaxID=28760 RepID=A0AAV9QUB1_9TELE
MDLADGRQESSRDRWVQQQMEEAMRHLPANLEVLPSPLLLEQMERELVQRPSPPSSLVACPDPAAKPTSFSRSRKRRRGAIPFFSAGEEESPMAAAVTSGAVVSLPADVSAAASNPASSSATALSPRLAAAPPMPFSLAPARSSEATPDERRSGHRRCTAKSASTSSTRLRGRRKWDASAQVIGAPGDASGSSHRESRQRLSPCSSH